MKSIILLLLVLVAAGIARPPIQRITRQPLQKNRIELKSPKVWAKRVAKTDPRTGQEIYYDPKPRIELSNAKEGKYNLKWIGHDGKEKVILYQRPDMIDVLVSASVTRDDTGLYTFEYKVQNLKSSGEFLTGFAVQNFSSDIIPKKLPTEVNNVFIGRMSKTIIGLNEGTWIRFAPLPGRPRVMPGGTITFKLKSSSQPGLVKCRAHGGEFVLKGVGEEMPEALEALLPAYEAWPSGYTIGPIDRLKGASQQERVSYLLEALPQCQKQGWMTNRALQTYEQLLGRGDLQGIFTRIANDLKTNSITTEVFAMIEGMKN